MGDKPNRVNVDLSPSEAVLSDGSGVTFTVAHGSASFNGGADSLIPFFEGMSRLDDVAKATQEALGVPVTIRFPNGSEIVTDIATINPLLGLNLQAAADVNESTIASIASYFMSDEIQVDADRSLTQVANMVQQRTGQGR